MDPLARAKAKQRDVADRTMISIPLSLLQDLIAEVDELREAAAEELTMETTNAQAPKVHGRPGLRPVGCDEGRSSPAREGQHGPDNAA